MAVEVSAGNLNERGFVIGLVEHAACAGWLRAHRDPVLLADRGYDSERLRDELDARGVAHCISRRRHHTKADGPPAAAGTRRRRKPPPPDPLARYRWPVERTFSWLLAWRRIWVRWERRADMYEAFVQIAQIMVLQAIIRRSL